MSPWDFSTDPMRARACRSKRGTNAKQLDPPWCTVDLPAITSNHPSLRFGILLGLQIPFASLGYPMSVTTNTIGINLSVERQHILEQLRRHAIGYEGGPLAFPVKPANQVGQVSGHCIRVGRHRNYRRLIFIWRP